MNSSDPIGGYFELELAGETFLHSDAVLLNSGRRCFEYVLRVARPSKVHLPAYICEAMIEPVRALGIPLTFFQVDGDLQAVDLTVAEGEVAVIVDYFGIKSAYCEAIAASLPGKVIIDASQSYFAPPSQSAPTFYSPRKFFGVADGGCLYTRDLLADELSRDASHQRARYLLQRVDVGAEAGYESFRAAEADVAGQPIKEMSNLTRRLLGSIDFDHSATMRLQNFAYLHAELGKSNRLHLADPLHAPLSYPLRTQDPTIRQRLIEHRIFVPTYWPSVLDNEDADETVRNLVTSIIPLPIDQRYGLAEMERILDVVGES